MNKQNKAEAIKGDKQEKQELLCEIHNQNAVIAIQTSLIEKNQLKCIQCVIDENISGQDLLSISEIQRSAQHSILANWPPLENNSILQEINSILMFDKSEKQEIFSKIKIFFNDFREKFEARLSYIEGQYVHRAQQYLLSCSDIMEAYNTVAEKEYLQVLFSKEGNFSSQYDSINEQMQALVESKLQEQQKNEEFLKRTVEQFLSTSKVVHFILPQGFKEEYLSGLSKMEVNQNHIVKQSSREKITSNSGELQQQPDLLKETQSREIISNLQKLSSESIGELITLSKKMGEIESQNTEERNTFTENTWGNFRQNSFKVYNTLKNSQFCEESKLAMKKTLQKFPVFDIIQPLTIDMHNRLHSVKLTNQFQLIMSNNSNYQSGRVTTNHESNYVLEKNQLDGYLISYSNMFLNPKDKYVIKFQIEKNSVHDWIVVGLMPDQVRDKSTLYEQQICYHYGYGDFTNYKILKGKNIQSDYIQRGETQEFELRICIQDKLFMVTDYPKHENVAILNNANTILKEDTQYRFSIALYNPGDKVILQNVEVVQQFSQL